MVLKIVAEAKEGGNMKGKTESEKICMVCKCLRCEAEWYEESKFVCPFCGCVEIKIMETYGDSSQIRIRETYSKLGVETNALLREHLRLMRVLIEAVQMLN